MLRCITEFCFIFSRLIIVPLSVRAHNYHLAWSMKTPAHPWPVAQHGLTCCSLRLIGPNIRQVMTGPCRGLWKTVQWQLQHADLTYCWPPAVGRVSFSCAGAWRHQPGNQHNPPVVLPVCLHPPARARRSNASHTLVSSYVQPMLKGTSDLTNSTSLSLTLFLCRPGLC